MILGEFTLSSEEQTIDFANNIAREIKKGDIVTFSGELGSGKSFLCRYIIKYLCGNETNVSSPTFNLLQIYQAKEFLIYHFDLYRLKSLDEIYELGIEDAWHDQVCLIEWPGIIDKILPKETIRVEIILKDTTTRIIKVIPKPI